jgi:hypothetical protein
MSVGYNHLMIFLSSHWPPSHPVPLRTPRNHHLSSRQAFKVHSYANVKSTRRVPFNIPLRPKCLRILVTRPTDSINVRDKGRKRLLPYTLRKGITFTLLLESITASATAITTTFEGGLGLGCTAYAVSAPVAVVLVEEWQGAEEDDDNDVEEGYVYLSQRLLHPSPLCVSGRSHMK